MLNYAKLVVGEMVTNCYLLWSPEKTAVIIDPGDEGTEIAQEIYQRGLKPMTIMLTHGHFDHILGVVDLKLIFKIPVAMGHEDLFLVDRARETAKHFLGKEIRVPKITKIEKDFEEIKTIRLGSEKIEVIKSPGHTPGGVCFWAPESKLLFSGDTLFANGFVGETGHQYSSKSDLLTSVDKLLKLPPDTVVLPGHGEETTIGKLVGLN